MKKLMLLLIFSQFLVANASTPLIATLSSYTSEPIPPAGDTDFNEVLKNADFYRGGQVEGISWDVAVIDIEKGRVKDEIVLNVEAASEEERQFSLVNFMTPKKYEGRKFLVRDNNMWFSKPGLRNPVPISGRERLSGQASNADVASVNYYHDYSIESTEEAELNGEACWVLHLKAKNSLVSYAQIKYWVSKDGNYGLRADYHGPSGKKIKSADFEYDNEITYKGNKYNFISKVIIYDGINQGDQTDLNLSNIRFQKFGNAKFQKSGL